MVTTDRVIFQSIADYLGTCKSIDAKIVAIDAIIDALLANAATAAESGHLDEYWYDDGHVKVRTKYRTVEAVMKGIQAFRTLREDYVNRKVGRGIRRMDQSNFLGRWRLW